MGGFAGANHFATSGAVGPKVLTNAAQGFGQVPGYVNLMGWSVRETGGTSPVTITLHDGASSSGNIIAEISVPAGTSMWSHFGPEGVKVPEQVFAVVAGTGTLSGVLYIR